MYSHYPFIRCICMFSGWSLMLIISLFILFLTLITWVGDLYSFTTKQKHWMYSLGLGIHCTSWALFGTVTQASQFGWAIVPTYLGIIVAFIAAFSIIKKVSEIVLTEHYTSLADLFVHRFKSHQGLSALVTLICFIAVIPYVSLQLSAISDVIRLLMPNTPWLDFMGGLVAICMLSFTLFFTASRSQDTQRNGLIFLVATTSLIKLFSLLLVMLFIFYDLFDGFFDFLLKAAQDPLAYETLSKPNEWWIFLSHMFLGVVSLFCLPRQFHMTFVEQPDKQAIHHARWVFPIYLIAMSLPILPIALAGNMLLQEPAISTDLFTLALPFYANNISITSVALLGGFSAAFVMTLITTYTLSLMTANHLFTPLWLNLTLKTRQQSKNFTPKTIQYLRSLTVVIIVMFAWGYFELFSTQTPLSNMGFISLALIAQIFPSLLGVLYFRKMHIAAPFFSIVSGWIFCVFSLLYPNLVANYYFTEPLSENLLSQNLALSIVINVLVLYSCNFLFIYVLQRPHSLHREEEKAPLLILHEELDTLCRKFLPSSLHQSLFKQENSGYVDYQTFSLAQKALIKVMGTPSTNLLLHTISQPYSPTYLDSVARYVKDTHIVQQAEFSEQKEVLEQARKQAEVQSQQKTQFLAAAGHDLMQPFNAAQLLASILEEKAKATPLHPLSEDLKVALNHAEGLLNMLMEVSKIESGIIKPRFTHCHLPSVIKPLLTESSLLADKAGLNLRYKGVDCAIYSDPILLTRIIQNVLSNAIRYTSAQQKKHKKVLVTLRKRQNEIYIDVYDTGPGIPADALDKIFQDFMRLPTNTDDKGLGLGLSIVNKLIGILGYKISVQSKVDKGSRFRITIPASHRQQAKSKIENEVFVLKQSNPQQPTTSLQSLHIVLLENDAIVAKAMAKLFQHWQVQYHWCRDAQSLEDYLKINQHIDFIFIDYHLDKQQNGIDIWSNLSTELKKHVKVGALLTADKRENIQYIADNAGLYYLAKPIKPFILKRFIKKHRQLQ